MLEQVLEMILRDKLEKRNEFIALEHNKELLEAEEELKELIQDKKDWFEISDKLSRIESIIIGLAYKKGLVDGMNLMDQIKEKKSQLQ